MDGVKSNKAEKKNEPSIKISVITATYNSIHCLQRLIVSLRSQTDKDFEWVVADGGSTDGTLELLKSIDDLNIVLSSQADFGIYDAINRGVKLASGDYYVVIGSDDYFLDHAIEKFRESVINSEGNRADLVASAWKAGGKIYYPGKNLGWLHGMLGVSSCHSVATLIKRDLHSKYGFYSQCYPLCADQLFVKTIIRNGAVVNRVDFVAGEFFLGGASGNVAKLLTELLCVQLRTEKNKILQILIFLAKLIKNYRKLG